MLPFDRVFTELARREVGVIYAHNDPALPDGTYVFREFFSVERAGSRPAMEFRIYREGDAQPLASLSYELGSIWAALIPDRPQHALAETLLSLFQSMLAWDPAYGDQLENHHASWLEVLTDPTHRHRERLHAAQREETAGVPAPLRWWMQ